MRQSTARALALPDPTPTTTWFDARSCVVLDEDGTRRVFVGGRLVGSFDAKGTAERNVLLIAIIEEPHRDYRVAGDHMARRLEHVRQ